MRSISSIWTTLLERRHDGTQPSLLLWLIQILFWRQRKRLSLSTTRTLYTLYSLLLAERETTRWYWILKLFKIQNRDPRSKLGFAWGENWQHFAPSPPKYIIQHCHCHVFVLCCILPSHDMTNSFELCHILVTNATVRRSSTSSLKECGISRERWSNNTVP